MAKKLDSIVELAAQKTREISANSGNYMAFLTTAAHNFKYNFRDQLLIYAQKPDATACAQIDFWNKHGRYVNRGTRGIALLVDTDQGYKLRYVFDMSDTNSRQGRTIPIWKMEPRYEDTVIEALENSYGEFPDLSGLAACLLETAKVIVEDNFGDYLTELRGIKEGSLLEELDDLSTEAWFKGLVESSVAFIMLTRCGIDPMDYFSGEDFAHVYDFDTPETLSILGGAVSDIAEMPLREIASTVLSLYRAEQRENRTFAQTPNRQYHDGRTKQERSVEHGTDIPDGGRLPPAQSGSAGAPKVGKYGMLRRSYLQTHRNAYYTGMLLSGRLNAHLEKIDRQATEMVEQLTARMAREQGVTEELKASDQMKWVGLMNNIRAAAEEVALTELVYADT